MTHIKFVIDHHWPINKFSWYFILCIYDYLHECRITGLPHYWQYHANNNCIFYILPFANCFHAVRSHM